ncbi:hypothetical protein [Xenorhabdus innexi]|uniref:Uncharacterized protein n=1 Tax=Xenorhabdus innexi TaxID=290109 RepID=A0A1N6N104_9GAMM|nr:hypothetical protein [Xenorhabdus innexi]PHM31326.1 hypothetical protein Xinn_02872 [Xenorhabdus innexi]SIP74778.1 conserved hypothetical protein [Xenorhabdus innexi]
MTTRAPIEVATNQDIQIELREVYVVRGANRAYLSESGALNKLAYIRAQEQFDKEKRPSNYPAEKVKQEDGTTKLRKGAMRPDFMRRQERVLEELKADIRQIREIARLEKECRTARDNLLTVLDNLEKAKNKNNN